MSGDGRVQQTYEGRGRAQVGSTRRLWGSGPRLFEPLMGAVRTLFGTALLAWALSLLYHALTGTAHLVDLDALAVWGWILALSLFGQAVLARPSRRPVGGIPPTSRGRAKVDSPPRVSVVIPALNEAENLRHVLPRLPDGLHEVILVDGHSTDGTTRVAREVLPSIRIVTQSGRGKGDAFQRRLRGSHRRHHRHARRRRLRRSGRDPALRRRPRRGRRLRQGVAVHRGRRKQRHHQAPPARQLRRSAERPTSCTGPATPTSATATTPSGSSACRTSRWTFPDSRSRRWLMCGLRRPACRWQRCRASRRSASTVKAISTPFVTAFEC